MDIILTPRLKLILTTKAGKGSPELEWFHQLRSNEESMFWSIGGHETSIEDTEKSMQARLPPGEGGKGAHRIIYTVHEVIEGSGKSVEGESQSADEGHNPTKFIGMISLSSLNARSLELPEHLTLPATAANTTLTVEVSYMFLPAGWGKGYATESVEAVFESCKKMRSFWSPYTKLYVRAIVNKDNPASFRVMNKVGMINRGMYHWRGEPLFLAGEWRSEDQVHIFGMYLIE